MFPKATVVQYSKAHPQAARIRGIGMLGGGWWMRRDEAEEIARRINAHAALVDACNLALAALEDYKENKRAAARVALNDALATLRK